MPVTPEIHTIGGFPFIIAHKDLISACRASPVNLGRAVRAMIIAILPKGLALTPGVYYNPVMDGGKIAMKNPLSADLVEYADGTEATVEQMARDVTEFLAWSADPKMEVRKEVGLATMLYLFIFTILMWLSYRHVWRNVKH